jgi:hypothetical protein
MAHDPQAAIAYEGIRKWKRGAAVATADLRTTGGRVLQGNFASTHVRKEEPQCLEVIEESAVAGERLEHIWEFELPQAAKRWLVVAAERSDGGHLGNSFAFSIANDPAGPYTPAFSVEDAEAPQVVAVPEVFQGKLYVKAESTSPTAEWSGQDQLLVDAMAISYRSSVGPFAQGDQLVTFVALLEEATAPIVLYRPEEATTDLGLYGSSHVGILGGVVRTTNVDGILRLDLLKTDYYHDDAYPTYLYYNPHAAEQVVELDLGAENCDLYDAATDSVLQTNATGKVSITLSPDAGRVVVLAPAGSKLRRDGKRTLINDVVVRY